MALLVPFQLSVNANNVPTEPTIWIIGYLLSTIGSTSLLLCSVAPLLQYWYGELKPDSNPYLLYAASNLGSFLGILIYPLFVESRLGLSSQFELWRICYFVLLFLLSCGILITFKNDDFKTQLNEAVNTDETVSPKLSDRLRWLFLAAIPVSLSLSLTTYITQDLGSFPLLWVLPLGLYLLSYIKGFSEINQRTLLVSPYKYLLISFVVLGFNSFLPIPHQIKFLLSIILFYQLSLAIHNHLYNCRPHTSYLTQFYLFTALGGVCGGLINAIIAPNAYKFTIEYAIFLILSLLINPNYTINISTHDDRSKLNFDSGFLLKRYNVSPNFIDKNVNYIIILSTILIGYILFSGNWHQYNFNNVIGILVPLLFFVIAIFKFDSTKYQKVIVFSSIIGILFVFKPFGNYIFADRSYFGSLQVVKSDKYGGSRNMLHGTTLHGFQLDSMLENPPSGLEAPPLGYYSAVKELTEQVSQNYTLPVDVGIVGLGTGISAIYTTEKDTIDFYEIDPLVIKVASDSNYFTYLNKSKGKVSIIEGDARLTLANSKKKYDLLVLDAFSSDAIPTHLLSQEAFKVYHSRLKSNGLLLVHISNRYFDLTDSVAKTVNNLRLVTAAKTYKPTKESLSTGEITSKWLAVADSLNIDELASTWEKVNWNKNTSTWTDNYSNLLQALQLFGVK